MEHISNITTVLFDLDGTLLPMDQDLFVKDYFNKLGQKMGTWGYDPKLLLNHVWNGISCMIKSQDNRLNEEVFWEYFQKAYGKDAPKLKHIFEEFYKTEFQEVQSVCGFTPKAKETILFCQEKGLNTILATNPLFPSIATYSRVYWAGLQPSDFSYITTYENSSHCKPDPKYYQEILSRHNLTPSECLMVGNDASEDMIAATLGIHVFLLTDCLINTQNADISKYPQGNFSSLIQFIKNQIHP